MKFNKINNSLLLFISSFVITNVVADNSCSKEIQEIGYKCCSDDCKVVYSDIDGDWGFEDGHWCGCGNVENPTTTTVLEIEPTPTNVNNCDPNNELGWSCCSDDCTVVVTAEGVNWGIENNKLCICNIENSKTSVITTTTTTTTTTTVTTTSTTTSILTTTLSSIVTTSAGGKGTSQGKMGGGMDYEVYSNNSGKNKAIFNSEDDSFSCSFEKTAEIRCLYGPSHTNYDLESSDKDILVNFELGNWEIRKSRISIVGVYGEFDNSKLRFSIIEILDDPEDYFTNIYNKLGVVNNYTIYSGNGIDYRSGDPLKFKEIYSVRNTPTGGETFTLKKHFNDWKDLGFEFSKLTKLQILVSAKSVFNDRDAAGYVEVQNAFIKKIRQPIDGYEKPLNSTETPTPTPTPTPSPTPQLSNCSEDYKYLGYDCCPSPCTAIHKDSYGNWGIYEGDWCGCDE